MKKSVTRQTRKGLALVEVAMVLGIAAIVIAGAAVYFAVSNRQNAEREHFALLASMRSAVSQAYTAGTINSISTDGASGIIGFLPSKYRPANATSTHVVGPLGQIFVNGPSSLVTGSLFRFEYNVADYETCRRHLRVLADREDSVVFLNAQHHVNAPNVTQAEISTWCSAVSASSPQGISLIFTTL